jgi:hypothetical protein
LKRRHLEQTPNMIRKGMGRWFYFEGCTEKNRHTWRGIPDSAVPNAAAPTVTATTCSTCTSERLKCGSSCQNKVTPLTTPVSYPNKNPLTLYGRWEGGREREGMGGF